MHRLYLPYLLHTYICRQVDSTVANQPSVKHIGQHLLSSLNHLTIAIIPSSFNNLLPYVPRSLLRYLPTSHTLTLPTSSSTTFLSARGWVLIVFYFHFPFLISHLHSRHLQNNPQILPSVHLSTNHLRQKKKKKKTITYRTRKITRIPFTSSQDLTSPFHQILDGFFSYWLRISCSLPLFFYTPFLSFFVSSFFLSHFTP